jgi:hypothetical protein
MANGDHKKRSWRHWLERLQRSLRPIDPSQLGRREIAGGFGILLSFGASYAMRDTAKYLGLSAPGGYALATLILGLTVTILWVKRLPD